MRASGGPPGGKPPSASRVETSHMVMPQDTNPLGNIFGGRVIEWVDVCAAIAAFRHCRRPVVTANMDDVYFFHPIRLGEIVILQATVNFVHRTSLEVGVRVEAEEPVSGARRHTNSAYLTFVALDDAGRPTPVPSLLPEGEEERRRWAAAEERRHWRLERMRARREQRDRARLGDPSGSEGA